MYIPKRLQPYFEMIQEKYGANIITKGVLSCCGCHEFNIMYEGILNRNLLGKKILQPSDNGIVLVANCKICTKGIVVFNSYSDGYDNYVNEHLPKTESRFNNFVCSKCAKDNFSISISFEHQSKEELEEDGIQEYEDAFSWIWVSLTCTSCKKKYMNLIDFETA